MDAGRVIGSLREHCALLEADIRQIDLDLENSRSMRAKYGEDFDEPVRLLERLKEAKSASLRDAEGNLITLVTTYEHSQRLLNLTASEESVGTAAAAARVPWSTIINDNDGQLTVLTSSPILQFSNKPHIRNSLSPTGPNRR